MEIAIEGVLFLVRAVARADRLCSERHTTKIIGVSESNTAIVVDRLLSHQTSDMQETR